jgi:hypothetical protein
MAARQSPLKKLAIESICDMDSILITDKHNICELPFEFVNSKCVSCNNYVITSETCIMMSCKCIYCYNCMFRKTRCTLHRKISIATYHDRRINTINKYDLLIYTAIDAPIEKVVKQLYNRGDANRLLKNIDDYVDRIEYALLFEKEATYDLAIVLVAEAAIKYYVFRLYLPIEVSDKIHMLNIQYMYKLLKQAHIYIATC